MFKMTIKTKILAILIFLVGVVSLSLLFSQYHFSEKIALKSANDTFQIISKNISEHMKKKAKDTRNILKAKVKHQDILAPIDFDSDHPALHGLIEVLQFNTELHAIYFAQPDGNYYEVINMMNRPKMFKVFDAPVGTYWTVVVIIDNIQQNTFLDEHYRPISRKHFANQYNPHDRPWYKEAIAAKKVVSIKPYMFAIVKQLGITFSVSVENTGVVLALDYTMQQLNETLNLQKYDKDTEIFIVDAAGQKFASSAFSKKDMSEVQKPMFTQETIVQHLDKPMKIQEGDKKYFMIFHPLLKGKTYLGIKLNADDLLKTHRDNISYSFLIAFILLLLSIPFIWWAAGSIARPIKDLIEVNHKIQNRQLSEIELVPTNIVELEELSGSLVAMAKSIQKHEKAQEDLLDAIIKLIAEAVDEKSPYTGKHCERVPHIAQMLLREANLSQEKAFKTFSLTSKDELREFEIAAWLHDCGKVTTPEYIVDKAVKLEMIYNRIHEIRMRFEVLSRDALIEKLKGNIDEETLQEKIKKLQDDFAFVAALNLGEECMDESKKIRIQEISKQTWQRHFDNKLGLGIEEKKRYLDNEILPVTEPLLSDNAAHTIQRENFDYEAYEKEGFKLEVPKYLYNYGELYNLCIEKGTLTEEERYKINEHVIMSIKMLEKIPFPENMTKIPEYAGTHHETLIGTGYPKKLTKEELSIPSRIMAIADIFEALTASDRPYKKEKTLSESIHIMHNMVKQKHIDEDLFRLFLRSGVYKEYASAYLNPAQIDEVNLKEYLG